MDASSRSPLPSKTCYRVKSWRNLWLSAQPDQGRPVTFVRQEEDSSAFALLPSHNGLYMLRLILPRPSPSSSADSASIARSLASTEEHTRSRGNAGWFLRPQGHSVVAAWNDFGSAYPEFYFRLEFDENGWVRFRGGNDDGYLSSDNDGHLRSGIRKPKKWESFQLYENVLPGNQTEALVHAPVRVNLKAHTGKYLCAAKSVVSALAEAPCCCEEFLLDLSFPPLSPSLAHWEARSIEVEDNRESQNKYCKMQHREECRIRTSDGLCNLSAEADGMLLTVPVDQLQGKESFFIELFYQRGQPIVHIRHGNGNVQQKHYPLYVTAEQSGKLACNKSIKRKWEEFGLELANSSRVLIRSVHGGFLACTLNLERDMSRRGRHQSGNGYSDRKSEQLCSCTLDSRKDMEKIGAWRLIAHGDSLFTVVAMPTPKNGSDSYLFADATGRILQSSEPAVHFPATASLFEIKPATTACIIDSGGHSGLQHHSRSIVGFTIRTVKKIRGKQRYLSAEPNGTLSASRTQVSRWEIFQLIDVDAAAAVSSQPARGKLNIQMDRSMCSSRGHSTVLPNAGWRDAALSASLSASATAQSSQTTAGGRLFHSDSLKWVSGVSAEALNLGRAVPKSLPSSLQELCIRHICLQACEGFDLLRPISNTNDITEYDLTRIPEDMLSRIRNHLQARKHPEYSCKMSPITYAAHDDHGVQNYRNGVHGQAVMSRHSNWVLNDEGWHCGTCGQVGILSMDPSTNPAHYRYLESQYRAHNGFVQPTGILWNLISFVGVSVMSTALLFQIFSDSGGRRNGHSSR